MRERVNLWTMLTMAALAIPAPAQSDTSFTYQSALLEEGAAADGSYGMEFALWDAPADGTQIGDTISLPAIAVREGLFTAELDFGVDGFTDAPRWLEIVIEGVRLSPRQPITRAPYAVQTRGMTVGADGNVLLHSLAAAKGSVKVTSPGGIDLVLDADTNNAGGEDQNSRIVLRQDGGQVVARLGHRDGQNDLEIMHEYAASLILGSGNRDRVWIRPDGFVGVGRSTKVSAQEDFGVYSDADSGFGGMYVQTLGDDAAPFYGYSAGGDIDAYHYFNGATKSWHLYNNGEVRMTVLGAGSVGIGTVQPSHRLHVVAVSGATQSAAVAGHFAGNASRAVGVLGVSDATDGYGVRGEATAATGNAGVYGASAGAGGSGVIAFSSAGTGLGFGVLSRCNSPDGYDFYADGPGQDYGSSSSRRWKHAIEPIDDPLGKVSRLRGVCFDWDADHGGHRDIGMIAEEVGEVLPEIVGYEENGVDALGMDYAKLTPLLVEAVKALRSERDTEIALLRSQLEAVRTEAAAERREMRSEIADLRALVERLAASRKGVTP